MTGTDQASAAAAAVARAAARVGDGGDALRCLAFVAADLPREAARMAAWQLREAVRNRRGRPLPSYRFVPRYAPT